MSGWTTKKLGEIGTIVRGKGIRRSETISKGMPCIRYGEIYTSYDILLDEPHSFVAKEIFDACPHIKHGDVVFTLTGENKEEIAKTLAYLGNEEIAAGGDLAIWKGHGFNAKFLAYVMNSPQLLKAKALASNGDIIVHASLKKMAEIPIPIPPLAEQKRIVAKIDAAFEKIDRLKANAEKNLANAKELFQSALDEAMRPKKGWVEKRLPDISENNDSKRVPITKNQREPGSIPYYGASGIVDYVKDYIFDGEYLLVSEDGANLESRTYPIAFPITGKSWVNNHAHILEFKNGDVQAYVEFYLNAISLKDFITGTAQPKLTQENLNKIPIHLPSDHAKLSEIVRRLKLIKVKLETLQQNYARQIADCAEMRQAILREAFEGRL